MMERRAAIIEVSAQRLLDLFKEGVAQSYRVSRNGIPKDGQIIGAHYDTLRDVWLIGVESEQFQLVPEYAPLPVLPPIEIETTMMPAPAPTGPAKGGE